MRNYPNILQINTSDNGGGAERVVLNLHRAYLDRGYCSILAVGHKKSENSDIFVLSNCAFRNNWAKFWIGISNLLLPLIGKVRGISRIRNCLAYQIGQTPRWLEVLSGHEDFDYPATWYLLNMLPEFPDIIHCHNLHGGYFDLRAIPSLNHQIPIILTLHDAWLLTGHCAHSFECHRWKTGCGHCPDLSIYPSIRRDATALNWRTKRDIYAKSRLYVSTPCDWLMQKVENSMLAPAVVESKVIPYGVDLTVFNPADKDAARKSLSIPSHSRALLFTANTIKGNIWKDYQTLRSAFRIVADHMPEKALIFLALGENAPKEKFGQAEVRFIPYQKEPRKVARYYQAADVYVHAANADTFPNTVLEALACGVPVLATAVGGIPEQIKSLEHRTERFGCPAYGPDEATGVLVPPADAEAMASAIEMLLENDSFLYKLGRNASENAKQRFNLERQVNDYLNWYKEIIENCK